MQVFDPDTQETLLSEHDGTSRIYKRIEALLRLAEDPEATPEEQSLALARAAEIAAKYHVNAARLDPHSGQYTREDIVHRTFPIPTSYGLSAVKGRGVYQVVTALGAQCFFTHIRRTRDALTVYASESTMEVLKALLPSLIIQEATASAAYLRKIKADDPVIRALHNRISQEKTMNTDPKPTVKVFNAEIRRRRKSFCLAFFVEAAKTVKKKRADAVQSAGEKYALVLVDTQDRIAQALEDLELKNTRRRASKWSMDAWEKGSSAGANALVGQTEVNLSGRISLSQ